MTTKHACDVEIDNTKNDVPTYDGLSEGEKFTNTLVWHFGTRCHQFPITLC